MLADKKVYVGKFGKEIIEKAERLGFKRGADDLEKMPFLIFVGGFNTIRSMFYVDSFNQHPFKEVTPEWILSLPEVDKSNGKLGLNIKGFEVTKDNIIPLTIIRTQPSEEFDVYNILPSEKEAKAYRVLPKLLYWRDKYNDGWKPDWNDKEYFSIGIDYKGDVDTRVYTRSVLTFKTKALMDKFLDDFREELEIVKPLL